MLLYLISTALSVPEGRQWRRDGETSAVWISIIALKNPPPVAMKNAGHRLIIVQRYLKQFASYNMFIKLSMLKFYKCLYVVVEFNGCIQLEHDHDGPGATPTIEKRIFVL